MNIFKKFLQQFHMSCLTREGQVPNQRVSALLGLKSSTVKLIFTPISKNSIQSTLLSLFHNQKGMGLLAPSLTLLIFSLGTLLIYKSLHENSIVKDRTHAFLCLKEYESSRRSYIKKMAIFNSTISGAFLLKFTPPPAGPIFKSLHGATKNLQQIYHVSHLKNPFTFKFCPSLITLPYYKNLPYKTKNRVSLVRRLDGTVPLVKKKWNEYIWSKRKKIVFKSEYELGGRFSRTPNVKRREFSKEALYNLKELYGLPSLSF